MTLATFYVGNGLITPEIPLMTFKIYNKHWDDSDKWQQRFREFGDLFPFLNKANDPNDPDCHRMKTMYYFHSMIAGQSMYFDGDLLVNRNERKKYIPSYV